MDGLTNDERALAWAASWHPSFSGIAIVNSDFTFRAVNPQFCEVLGVTPAELIGNRFSDLTPQPVKELDIKNAELVKKRWITSYLLPKEYEFSGGRRVSVILLVCGVYSPNNSLLFYVSRIMGAAPALESLTPLQSATPKPTSFIEFINKCWHLIITGMLAVATLIAFVIDKLHLLPQ